MKTFTILLLISFAALIACSEQDKPQIAKEKRLGFIPTKFPTKIPENVKKMLKTAAKAFVSVMISCIKAEFKKRGGKF